MKEFPSGPFSKYCIACQSNKIKRDWGIISSFFALRALRKPAQLAGFMKCENCNSRYFDVALSDEELNRFYTGYRGPEYVEQRSRFEPSYTPAFNASLGGDAGMAERRAVLAETLTDCGIEDDFDAVLDHGGDRGQMLKGLNARRKAVFDISSVELDSGIEYVREEQTTTQYWDLILCCHVLEHLTNPQDYMKKLASIGRSGTVFFFELPYEPARSLQFNQTIIQKIWLYLLLKNEKWLTKFDMLSGGFVSRNSFVPPFMFFALREHLSFFTEMGAKKLIESSGLSVLSVKRGKTGHILAVAKKY